MIAGEKTTWRMLAQPVAVFIALGAIIWWISNADLSETEQVTLTVP